MFLNRLRAFFDIRLIASNAASNGKRFIQSGSPRNREAVRFYDILRSRYRNCRSESVWTVASVILVNCAGYYYSVTGTRTSHFHRAIALSIRGNNPLCESKLPATLYANSTTTLVQRRMRRSWRESRPKSTVGR